MTALAEDVNRRLVREYPGEMTFVVTRFLEELDLTPRVLRSIVFLAHGNWDELQRLARRAEIDWRDVVFWAEYEDHEADSPRQVRSMDEPFA